MQMKRAGKKIAQAAGTPDGCEFSFLLQILTVILTFPLLSRFRFSMH